MIFSFLIALIVGTTCIGIAYHFSPASFDIFASIFCFENYFFGFLRQRNHFATLLNLSLVVFVLRVRAAISVLFICIAILSLSLSSTGSRTGLFQLVMLFILVLSFRSVDYTGGRSHLTLFGYALFVYVLFSMSQPVLSAFGLLRETNKGVLSRFADTSIDCQSRITLWSNVLTLISQKPWLGWGWNELDYAHFITLYPGERFCDILDNAHNLPLHLAVELGVPVALVFCSLFVWWIARNKPWRETDSTRQTCWAILMVIGIHSLLEYPLWYGPFQITTALCLLILWQTRPNKADTPSLLMRAETLVIKARFYISASIMLVCAFVGWNYYVVSQIYKQPEDRAEAYQFDTLRKVQEVYIFKNHARFAELSLTPLTLNNAAYIHQLSKDMLHHSPEPRVIEPLVESAVMLGRDDEAVYFLQRYKAAFPREYAAWVSRNDLRASSASAATHSPSR